MPRKTPTAHKNDKAVSVLQAVLDAEIVLFSYQGATGKLTLKGQASSFGLEGMTRGAKLSKLSALIQPSERGELDRLMTPQSPGAAVRLRTTSLSGAVGHWRGTRLADGLSCAGVILKGVPGAHDRDALTGLLTRTAFLDALSARLEDENGLHVVVGDIARVRRLNEALGYEVTDKVLSALGARLMEAFGPDALCARVGDNSFAVVLAIIETNPQEQLRAALEGSMSIEGLTIHPTLAIATADALPGVTTDAGDLLRRADAALGATKSALRARAGAPLHGEGANSLAHLTLEDDLRRAITRGEIEPFYQPIIRLEDSRLAGFEALVLWRHPRRGLLPPDDFLPLVSETGLMAELGLMMARAAARQVREWRALNLATDKLFISVNLTTGDLERPSLIDEVASIIQTEGLAHDALKLEITESEIMRDPDRAAILLQELRAVGATLSLDDFGMGFSSLSWLARLPISGLKIDRYFIRTMSTSEGSAKIVRSVISLAKDFGLEVVAEGVETAAMAHTLRNLGCQFGQGFGYALPMAAEEALVYLIERGLDRVRIQSRPLHRRAH